MPDAMARRRKQERVDTGDPFNDRVLLAYDWIRSHGRAAAVIGAAFVLLVLGVLYWRNHEASVRARAAADLQDLRMSSGVGQPGAAAARLMSFVDLYEGTAAAEEARLLLARVHLSQDSAQSAIRALLPVAERVGGSPGGYAAASLLAAAYEQAGEPDEALEWYGRIADASRFDFQREAAAADRARLLADMGRLGEAEQIYARLVAEAEEASTGAVLNARMYEIRLGEVRGRMEGGGDETAAGGAEPAASGAESAAESGDDPAAATEAESTAATGAESEPEPAAEPSSAAGHDQEGR